MPRIYLNGSFLEREEARLPIGDRGFFFADGIYEVTGSSIAAAGVALGGIDPTTLKLFERGIEIAGRIRPAERLPGLVWTPLATYRSDLLTIVEVTNRESQNFFAESLIRVLGAERCRLGTWEQGVEVVELFLDEAGLTRGSYHLADGSGLARTNRFSPAQMTTVLRHMANHRYFEELYGSLPYGGQEGTTMEDRFDESRYGERIHAKTGTLTGVTTLSGYARGRSGRLYAFSVLVNDPAVWLPPPAESLGHDSCDRVDCKSGSSCTVECKNSYDCDFTYCRQGAACLLTCTYDDDCEFEYCASGAISCGNGVLACGRPCP
mgnify:CR=1 FL=1